MSQTIRKTRASYLEVGTLLVENGADYPLDEVRWYGPQGSRVVRVSSGSRTWVFDPWTAVPIRPPAGQHDIAGTDPANGRAPVTRNVTGTL